EETRASPDADGQPVGPRREDRGRRAPDLRDDRRPEARRLARRKDRRRARAGEPASHDRARVRLIARRLRRPASRLSGFGGALRLVHNGEVYNYRELRRELEAKGHRFRSSTDTEVMLAAYREWGDRCVERFNGMWAFALWDGPRRRLFCSRDRFGVKPFYYRFEGGRFVFASEPRAFRTDPETRLEPNPRAIRDYLDQAYLDHTEETFFAGIRKLPPAHSLAVDENGLRVSRYWSLEEHEPPGGDAAE